MRTARLLLLLLAGMKMSAIGLSQTTHLKNDKYLGDFQIIYCSDSVAFSNMVSEYATGKNKITGCDTISTITITDTSFEVYSYCRWEGNTYRYYRNKTYKQNTIGLNFYPQQAPQILGVYSWLSRIYRAEFIPVTDEAFAIHFINRKTENGFDNGGPSHEEYFGDLYLIVKRLTGAKSP